jgi:hypothetical protein
MLSFVPCLYIILLVQSVFETTNFELYFILLPLRRLFCRLYVHPPFSSPYLLSCHLIFSFLPSSLFFLHSFLLERCWVPPGPTEDEVRHQRSGRPHCSTRTTRCQGTRYVTPYSNTHSLYLCSIYYVHFVLKFLNDQSVPSLSHHHSTPSAIFSIHHTFTSSPSRCPSSCSPSPSPTSRHL